MSAELLRRAAAKMRERAAVCQAGPWEWDGELCVTGVPFEDGSIRYIAETHYEPNAEHIASLHPAVADRIARWLDAAAGEAELIGIDHHALAVARAYLGEESS